MSISCKKIKFDAMGRAIISLKNRKLCIIVGVLQL